MIHTSRIQNVYYGSMLCECKVNRTSSGQSPAAAAGGDLCARVCCLLVYIFTAHLMMPSVAQTTQQGIP